MCVCVVSEWGAGERDLLRNCLEYSSYSINDRYLLVHSEKQQQGKAYFFCFVHQDRFKNH